MAPPDLSNFEPWLTQWRLTPDGAPFASLLGSRLLPARRDGVAAMLKVAAHPEERRGAAVMAWYEGAGAALVLAHDDVALLLERLSGPRSLTEMARVGQDAAATHVLCEAVARLHAPRPRPPPDVLVPLERWFAALWPSAERHGGVCAEAAGIARELLAAPEPPIVLHGDIHHDNVLDGGDRGWRAIDPKGLWGDRGFDYANLLSNPDAETAIANLPGRLEVAAALSGLPRERLLCWQIAYLGLSASWTLGDGGDASQALAILEAALGLL